MVTKLCHNFNTSIRHIFDKVSKKYDESNLIALGIMLNYCKIIQRKKLIENFSSVLFCSVLFSSEENFNSE